MTELAESNGPPAVLDPALCTVDLVTGAMAGHTGTKRSTIRDLDGLFGDGAAYARLVSARGDDIAYEVQEFRPKRAAPQELIFGTSTLQPGKVGAEFFMTRGHLHVRADRPEVYVCQRGRGVLHLEALSGETRPVDMAPGNVIYVPPYWIHRSVNIGNEPLITVFCYPADAGQDYAIIERSGGMHTLIVDDGADGWDEVINAKYRPRSEDDQLRYRQR
jgi:glucose-6-phosphate isomerase